MSALAFTAFTVLYQERVTADWRSVAAGAVQGATTLGGFGVNLGGGQLIVAAGYRAYYLAAAAAMLAGGVVSCFLRPRPEEAEAKVVKEGAV